MKLTELEVYFSNISISDEPLQLDQCTYIENQNKFVKSHISTLKANSGNMKFLPYYERLFKFYQIISKV